MVISPSWADEPTVSIASYPAKDRINHAKHRVSFALAQYAFFDPRRVIAEDLSNSG